MIKNIECPECGCTEFEQVLNLEKGIKSDKVIECVKCRVRIGITIIKGGR